MPMGISSMGVLIVIVGVLDNDDLLDGHEIFSAGPTRSGCFIRVGMKWLTDD